MRGLILFVAASAGVLLCGSTAGAQINDRLLRVGSLGRDAPFFYHHVEADCGWITHGFGRNDAWGLWRLPVDEVRVASAGPRQVAFDCIDGSACIKAGQMSATPDRIASHELLFETAEGATGFLEQFERLRTACAAD